MPNKIKNQVKVSFLIFTTIPDKAGNNSILDSLLKLTNKTSKLHTNKLT